MDNLCDVFLCRRTIKRVANLNFLGYTMYIILIKNFNTMSKTYQPKKKKRANTHGFLRRKKTKTGRQVIQKRRRKGRAKLTV